MVIVMGICLQRDLDFTVDFDYNGELSEASASLNFKMR